MGDSRKWEQKAISLYKHHGNEKQTQTINLSNTRIQSGSHMSTIILNDLYRKQVETGIENRSSTQGLSKIPQSEALSLLLSKILYKDCFFTSNFNESLF